MLGPSILFASAPFALLRGIAAARSHGRSWPGMLAVLLSALATAFALLALLIAVSELLGDTPDEPATGSTPAETR